MKRVFLQLFCLFLLTTFRGQNPSRLSKTAFIAKGATVSTLGDSLWVVFQDKHNNYWFGSNGEGAYRYDGKRITRFTREDGLSNDSIRQILEDGSGNLYFATLGGISKFDGKTFATLPVVESREWKAEPGDLWFVGNQEDNGPYRYDGKTLYHLKFPKHELEDKLYAQFPKVPFSLYQVYTVYKDSKERIWFGTCSFGVCCFDPSAKARESGRSLTWISDSNLRQSAVRSIIEDKNGNFWFGISDRGIYRYDLSAPAGTGSINFREEHGIGNVKGRREDAPVSYNSVVEHNGEFWLATYSAGVWRWQCDGRGVMHYPINKGPEDIMLVSIYKDRQGILWLGTCDSGVYKFNGKTFERFEP